VCVSVAILAQATAGPLPLWCHTSPPHSLCMAESIIAELHGRLLRGIAGETAVHYQGLRAAASHLRRTGLLDSRLAKKLAAVDVAFAISRHITVVSAEQVVAEVLSAIAYEVKAAAERKAEQVENEEVLVDKLAEEKAAAKEKLDLEQAAVHAAEEAAAAKAQTHLEQVANEKAAVEKATKVAAKKKFDLEQAAVKAAEEEKAAAQVKADEKFAEEQSAMKWAKEFQATADDAEWLAEVERILKTGTVAEFDLSEADLHRLQVCRAKNPGHGAVKVKPDGTQVTEEAAVVQPVAARGQATGEKAAKKAKVDRFDKVDMDLEALAYRMDSMPSPEELIEWRRSGWR
jgi:hypothetical protein